MYRKQGERDKVHASTPRGAYELTTTACEGYVKARGCVVTVCMVNKGSVTRHMLQHQGELTSLLLVKAMSKHVVVL